MVAPTVYRSTDDSAPSLTGQVGSLIALLDACLVNGYGSKAAAGWTKEYTGTNLAAFRMGTGTGVERMYLRVDDTSAQLARIVGYETMTAVSAGSNAFPTEAQFPGGLYVHKSTTANATARAWILLATPTAFYMISDGAINAAELGTIAVESHAGVFFGEYAYLGAGFSHNVGIIASVTLQSTHGCKLGAKFNTYSSASLNAGHYLARSYTGFSGSTQFAVPVHSYQAGAATTNDNAAIGTPSLLPVSNPVTGKLEFARCEVLVAQPSWAKLGFMPGMWSPITGGDLPNGGIITGDGDLTGRELLIVKTYAGVSPNSNIATLAIDLTDWS